MEVDFKIFYLFTFFFTVFLTFLIVISKSFHGRYTYDTEDGPQKIHKGKISRSGGKRLSTIPKKVVISVRETPMNPRI